MPTSFNDGGTWRECTETYFNDGGTWRECTEIYFNDGGIWRLVHVGNIVQSVETLPSQEACPATMRYRIRAHYVGADNTEIVFEASVNSGGFTNVGSEVVSGSGFVDSLPQAVAANADVVGRATATGFDPVTGPSQNVGEC